MQKLISQIAANAGLTPSKALEALEAVSNFIKEKYPLLASTVDSVLETARDAVHQKLPER